MESEIVRMPAQDPVKLLSDAIPEFTARLENRDLSLPYVVFGFFAQYLQSLSSGDPIFRRAIEFLNAMAAMGNVEFDNLLQVAIFESMAGNRVLSERIKVRLQADAMKLFLAAERAVNKF